MPRSRHSSVLPARAAEGRLLAGVCAALAPRLAIDVTLLRLAFLLLSCVWGLGLFAYGVLWLVLPAPGARAGGGLRGTVRSNMQNVGADVSASALIVSRAWQRENRRSWPLPLDRRWIAIGLIVAGAFLLFGSLGAFSWLTPMRGLGLAVIVFGSSVLLRMRAS